MHTKDILASELEKAGLTDMAAKARTGYYHDFLSPLAAPCMQLESDLRAVGTPAAEDIRKRHINGEFDATKEESDEWAKGPSGGEAMEILRESIAPMKGTSKIGDRVQRALRPDHQAFDEVRIVTVPRYKTSGLSGDEWRISARAEFYRKGVKIFERGWRNVETALRYLDWTATEACENGEMGRKPHEDALCDQEGCAQTATVTYRLKARYCRDGHKTEPYCTEVRRFCDKHKKRGDCGLDDADDNYETMN